jgi:hypothetical protein
VVNRIVNHLKLTFVAERPGRFPVLLCFPLSS